MSTPAKLAGKLFLFLLLWLIIFPYLITQTEVFHYLKKHYLIGGETYAAIHCSKLRVEKRKILVLGDSVARQLYGVSQYNDKIYSLACNQAVSLAGHHILLQNILKNNADQISKVYLVMHPVSFRNNLDQVYVFNYFIKPFYGKENYSRLTRDTRDRIGKVPLYFTSSFPIARITNYTPNLAGFDEPMLSAAAERKFKMSFVSLEYLKKMSSDLRKAGIDFQVVAPVLHDEYRAYATESLKKALADHNLEDHFTGYFQFRYLKKQKFVDLLHYSAPESLGPDPLRLTF